MFSGAQEKMAYVIQLYIVHLSNRFPVHQQTCLCFSTSVQLIHNGRNDDSYGLDWQVRYLSPKFETMTTNSQ